MRTPRLHLAHLPTPLETQSHPDAEAVRWWRRLGPAIRDEDSSG